MLSVLSGPSAPSFLEERCSRLSPLSETAIISEGSHVNRSQYYADSDSAVTSLPLVLTANGVSTRRRLAYGGVLSSRRASGNCRSLDSVEIPTKKVIRPRCGFDFPRYIKPRARRCQYFAFVLPPMSRKPQCYGSDR